jgi:hypothetical protein
MIQILDSASKSLDDITDMGDFGQLVIQIVDRGQNLSGAGNFGIGIANDVSRTVVGICDGALHLILELMKKFHVNDGAAKSHLYEYAVNKARGQTYIFDAVADLCLQAVELVRECAKTHRVQQQTALTAGGTGRARAGVAGSSGSSAPGHPIAGMAALQGNLLLLSEDLDLGGGKAKRSVGNRGCGHLVPAETCSDRDSLSSVDQSRCETERTTGHDGGRGEEERLCAVWVECD